MTSVDSRYDAAVAALDSLMNASAPDPGKQTGILSPALHLCPLDTLLSVYPCRPPDTILSGTRFLDACRAEPSSTIDRDLVESAFREVGLALSMRTVDPSQALIFGTGPTDQNAQGSRYLDALLLISRQVRLQSLG